MESTKKKATKAKPVDTAVKAESAKDPVIARLDRIIELLEGALVTKQKGIDLSAWKF